MVQLQPSLTLNLKNLASHGAVISAEQQAALDHSLPIKRTEAGLKTLTLWGKLTTLNGRDYLVAEGYNNPIYSNGNVIFDAKYYYSQDGVRWVDLVAVDDETKSKAGKIQSILSGDPAKVYDIEEKDSNQPPPPDEGEEAGEPPAPVIVQVPELAVLKHRIDTINDSTGVLPVHAMLPDAQNRIVPNRLFTGLAYPEKLESYMHRTVAPGGPTLAQDLRGTWSVHYDPFKQIATCRSLLWLGYTFYYDAHQMTWGALYHGNGLRNDDLIFML
ncbi:radial spoke protein 9 [Dunaliella salina]|uniref:Radial spoke head protein 9 homolog n=1 Tax=Dunaliella salina TaxID=3046 RepID=A0ABQ7FYT6_DUNSA|nr:radial spoke protein 9 [Dunaliella salina]|eukprot:KAF5827522.1 radial spoke protein 9 [Dunaliella salina]